MTLRTLTTSLAACALLPLAAHAAPYCDTLLDADALPGSYRKLAPIHSSTDTGWVLTDEMLRTDYAMAPEALALTQAIVDGFARRSIPLAIVMAPPRALVVDPAALTATISPASFDAAAARASFDQLIAQLDGTGALVPNLAAAATATPDVAAAFYFKRDTHWTAFGAAISAQALATRMTGTAPQIPATEKSETEKGSLAQVVRKVCDVDPAQEPFGVPAYPARTTDLLAQTQTQAVLLGTSFSNRYDKDFYRSADAMAWALDKNVENLSDSGTGMIGIIEGYVLNGGLDTQPELVIWETPSTESFNSTSNLRQLLGALHSTQAGTVIATAAGAADRLEVTQGRADLVQFQLSETGDQKIELKVALENGKTQTIKLQRRDRVSAALRSPVLAASFMGFDSPVVSVSVKYDGPAPLQIQLIQLDDAAGL